MGLSNELISRFVKVTNDKKTNTRKDSTVYGTIVETKDGKFLHIDGGYNDDGSQILQPIKSTVAFEKDDRVIVSIRNHEAVVTGNLTTPSTTVEHVKVVEKTITDSVEADYVKTDVLEANYVKTQTLETEYLNADAIEADYAKIEEMNVRYGEFKTLKSDYGVFKTAYADDLKATNADINNLDADVAHINELMFGSATGEVMQTTFANAVIALLGNAQIKSAMIESLSADKINAGSLNTKNVRIVSDDGSLLIFDNLIQIKDGTDVRIQIGKDAEGNYSILICDQNGATMFDANGITENAIKDAIIRNDMVAEDANISGSKIDIDSLITEINENGSTTIKSTKIVMDDEKQTLSAAFTSLSGDVEAQGTAITAIQGQIESKVWQQDIDESNEELSTQYTTLQQDVDSITTTVANHTAELEDTQSVTEDVSARLSVSESLVQQLADSISMLVTDENGSSLMTQTEDGWTFSTAEIQSRINTTAEDLHNLTEEVGDTTATVDILKQALDDLGVISEYVKIGTYKDEPCIELGEGDSDFKLLITNTQILFMDGSDVPAYITNKSLYIKKAVIEEELHQGNWVWKARSNGNLGLQWKGSDS